MRIAYVCMDAGIPVFGRKGASVHVQGVIAAMLRAGHEVQLFCARVGADAPQWAAQVAVHQVTVPAAADAGSSSRWIAAVNESLVDALNARGHFDVVYERYSLWSAAGMQYARAHGVPGILEVNAPLIEEQATHRSLADREGAERVASEVFAAASSIVAVSHEVAAYVNGFPRRRTDAVVEANGFDPVRFAGIERQADEPFTIGFLGTLKPWHGIETLAAVFAGVQAQLPSARLLVVGDGPERGALQATLGAAHDAGAVEFAGAVPPEWVGPWLARMDVALAPYPADAPFYFSPLKVVEYMAAGIAVVASDIGQIPSLIDQGRTGVLVPPGDVGACVDACLALHADPARRRALGEAGRCEAMATRTWDAVVARMLGRACRAQQATRVSA
ncbi:MAG: glycosyltransferase family 4 protein [Gemmatimonadaceae bacterium]|nr:glycosyltransferase family 4 protein [Gemmatimonadaceae bacterium]